MLNTLHMETFKTCSKCLIYLPIFLFGKKKIARDGHNHWCKNCCSEYSKKYREENAFYITKREAEYRSKTHNISRKAKTNANYYISNKVQLKHARKECSIVREHRESEALHDRYIKTQIYNLTGISRRQIPQDLVEAKRIHLKLTRKLKELKA
jgi:hypothetical protein